jgi:hypothetical protein
LFGGGSQLSRPGRLVSHPLDGIHDVAFLSQKRISKIRGPGNILRQVFQYVRKQNQRLNAGVPVLIPGGLRQRQSLQIWVPQHPLMRLYDFQWIRRGD